MSNFEMFQGEELIVTTDLTNIGSSKEDQTITLEIDGTQVDSQDVSVAAPSNGTSREQITLRWQSSDTVSTGTRTVKVSSEDDTDTHDIGIVDISESQFTVSVNSTNSPVGEGDTLTVDVDVTNNGNAVNAEPITLSIDNGIGQVDESDPVTVVPGNTKTITLEWQTSDGDGMSSDYTATVDSVGDSDSTAVSVFTPAVSDSLAGSAGQVIIWDSTDRSQVTQLTKAGNDVNSVAYKANNGKIGYASTDQSAYIHTTSDWSLLQSLSPGQNTLLSIAFRPGKSELAIASQDNNVYVYNTSTWSLTDTLSKASNPIDVVTYRPDGSELAYGTRGTNVYIHDASDKSFTSQISVGNGNVNDVDYKPDSTELAVCDSGGNWGVFDTSNYSQTTTNSESGSLQSIAYRPDGTAFAIASTDSINNNHVVFIYDSGSYSKTETLSQATDTVIAATYRQDNSQVAYATSNNDGNIYVHNTSDYSLADTITNTKFWKDLEYSP